VEIFSAETAERLRLRPWQEELYKTVVESWDSKTPLLINNPPGSGKTLPVLLASAATGRRAIVLVPSPVLYRSWLKYHILKDNGDAWLKVVPLYAKRHFNCKLAPAPADVSLLPCNRRMPKAEKLKACPYYYPPNVERGIKLGEWPGLSGYKVSLYGGGGGVCDYYAQYRDVMEADVIITTYDKFLYDAMMNRLPKVDVVVFDEAEMALALYRKRIVLDRETLKMVAEVARKAGLGDHVLRSAVEIGVLLDAPGGPPLEEVKEFLRILRDEIGLNLNALLEGGWVRAVERRGRVALIVSYLGFIYGVLGRAGVTITYITGTPLKDDDAAVLFGVRRVVRNVEKMLGRVVMLAKPLDPVYGLYWKREVYAQYVVEWCKAVEKAVLYMAERWPLLVPIVAYHHFERCQEYAPKLYDIYTSNLDEDGTYVEEFYEGKRRVVFTTRGTRGIHYPYREMAIAMPKYPYPDLEDEVVQWLLSTPRGSATVEALARSAVWQILGRALHSESAVLYFYTPDSRVVEALRSATFKLDIDDTSPPLGTVSIGTPPNKKVLADAKFVEEVVKKREANSDGSSARQ